MMMMMLMLMMDGGRRGSLEGLPSVLTDDKLHSKLVLCRFVRTVENDLDLELLASTDDETLGVVVAAVVLLLVDVLFPFHHVNVHDVKELYVDARQETRMLFYYL